MDADKPTPRSSQSEPDADAPSRRTVVGTATGVAMGVGLAASYGTFAGYAARFMYPAKPAPTGWMFVALVDEMAKGDALPYTTPGGATVTVTRQGDTGEVSDFKALSSTCPHLGCKVHWEAQNNRFFCPCHNGVFDPQGKGTQGPVADAKQSLPEYPLKVEQGMLFIEVPLNSLASAALPSSDDATPDHADPAQSQLATGQAPSTPHDTEAC